MIISWMLYAITLSFLLGISALLVERVFHWYRLPVRWVWAGAMALSLILPAAAYLFPATPPPLPEAPGAGEGSFTGFGALSVLHESPSFIGTDGSAWVRFDGAALGGWLLASVTLLLLLTASALWIRSRRRGWKEREVEGRRVFVSPDLGPAVIGLRRPAIVVPTWLLRLERRALELILTHEEEHLGARDTALLTAALLAVVLTPWNLPLWWHFRRLRLAVECDCDRRVLARGVRAVEYGALLLEVGRRVRRVALPATALAESPTLLERRLTMMNQMIPTRRRTKSIVALGLGILLIAFACEAPAPTGQDAEEEERATLGDVNVLPSNPDEPHFVPHTRSPEITNREEVARALVRAYPEELKAAGIGGVASVHFFVDAEGKVKNTLIDESSGHGGLDAAALQVANVFEFTPALNREEPVAVWVSIPIRFTSAQADTEEPSLREENRTPADAADAPPPNLPTEGDPEDGPVFVPHTVSPEVTNRLAVQRALVREYPAPLRDAGIGGVVHVHFFVDSDGRVRNTRIDRSSGHPLLDEAALRVAQVFEFTPALNRDEPVAVWIAIPLRFTTADGEQAGGGEEARAAARGETLAGNESPRIFVDGVPEGDGASGLIRRRGLERGGALDGPNAPLVFIDGVLIARAGSALDEIGPDDIERIEVFKGAAAARLYGERATHGVIEITMK